MSILESHILDYDALKAKVMGLKSCLILQEAKLCSLMISCISHSILSFFNRGPGGKK